jgi:hypothetical protein
LCQHRHWPFLPVGDQKSRPPTEATTTGVAWHPRPTHLLYHNASRRNGDGCDAFLRRPKARLHSRALHLHVPPLPPFPSLAVVIFVSPRSAQPAISLLPNEHRGWGDLPHGNLWFPCAHHNSLGGFATLDIYNFATKSQ